MDKTIIKNLEGYFMKRPLDDACLVTADGNIFANYLRKTAIDHAKTLDNDNVLIVSRGTNFEDWYYEHCGKSEEEVREELEKKKVARPKWGWWNWLYKLLH